MSEFKNGDKLLHEKYGEVTFVGLDPRGRGFACFDVGTCLGYVNLRLSDVKPKPKTITVELPKPEHIVRRHTSIEVYLKSVSDAEKAYSSLAAIIYPKGVE